MKDKFFTWLACNYNNCTLTITVTVIAHTNSISMMAITVGTITAKLIESDARVSLIVANASNIRKICHHVDYTIGVQLPKAIVISGRKNVTLFSPMCS